MKKLIYTIALVAMGMTASYAQKAGPGPGGREKGTPEQRAEKAATALQTKLNLTADQKQKVQALELERIKKNDEFRKKDDQEMKAKMEERKTFMKASKDKMDAILTPEQKKTLDASRDEMRDKMKDRKGGKGPRGHKGPKDGTPPPASN